MNNSRLQETGIFFFNVLCFILVVIISIATTANADEPEETLPVNISVDIHWEIDGGSGIRKGHFRMNAKSTLNLDRAGSGLDHKPKLTPLTLKYRGRSFTGSCHFEETLTQKDPDPPYCQPLLESYSGSRGFSYSPPEEYDSINLFLRRFGIAKSLIKSGVSGVGAQQFLAQLQSQMSIPPSYYDFAAGGVSGRHTIPGKKRKIENGECRYEKAETQVFMSVIGLRFPIPEDGPMEGKQTWSVKLDGPPRNFSIKLSQTGVGKEKPFRPENVASGGNATYSISWNFKEVSPDLRIQQEKEGTWVDITDKTVPVVVGKKMRLRGVVIQEKKAPKRGTWTIDGEGNHLNGTNKNYIKRYDAHFSKEGRVVHLKKDDLKKQEVIFYWIDEGSGKIKYVTRVDGEELNAEARFKIKRPNYQLTVNASKGTSIRHPEKGGSLDNNECWGAGAHSAAGANDLFLQYNGIDFKTVNLDKGEIDGKEQWVQIIKKETYFLKWDDGNRTCSLITDALDLCYPCQSGPHSQDAPGIPLEKGGERLKAENTDGIYTELTYTGKAQKNRMYLMFKPDGDDSEWVPIKAVDWEWRGNAGYYASTGWTLHDCEIIPAEPKGEDTAEYPEWGKNSGDESKYIDKCQ